MLHSKEAQPSSKGCHPRSSCCYVATEIDWQLDSGRSVPSLPLRRLSSMLVIISGSVWASSSHVFREESHISFAPLPLQMTTCTASSNTPQRGQRSSSHLPQCFIHFPTPRKPVVSFVIKCWRGFGFAWRAVPIASQLNISIDLAGIFSFASQ